LIKAGGISAKELLAMTDAEFRTAGSRREILADFRRTIETMHPTADSGYWTDYGTGRLDKIGGPSGSEPSPNDEDPRTYRILDLAAKASPRTVLDVGANDGVFSAHLARAGYEVLAVDTDEGAIDQFYRWVREKSEPLSAYACVNDFVSLPYQADLVVAAALTHHLALTDKFKFDYIAKRLAEMSRQSLITEFMGNGLGKHEPIPDPLPDYYTLGAFLAALREHFAEVESLEYERPAECSPRTLIFCTGRL